MRPSRIVTMDSFENAILVHAAISGSTNCLLHLPAIAHELGLVITGDTFDRLHRNARYLLDVRPAGRWPAEVFYYAGGVPAIMEEIRRHLHLDVMTVTGRTLGENLDELKRNGFYERCGRWLEAFNQRYGSHLTREDIIRPYDQALGTDGSIAILRGNLAPDGAVIKHTACPKEMFTAVLRARPFDSEEECLDAVLHHKVEKGDAVFIRYEGPKGSGMPEMFYTSGSHQQRQGTGAQHRPDYRRTLLRRLYRPGHRPLQSGSRRRRPHRPGGGRGPDRNRRARPEAEHHRRTGPAENAGRNGTDSGRAPRGVEAPEAPVPDRRHAAVWRTGRQPHERRLPGIQRLTVQIPICSNNARSSSASFREGRQPQRSLSTCQPGPAPSRGLTSTPSPSSSSFCMS